MSAVPAPQPRMRPRTRIDAAFRALLKAATREAWEPEESGHELLRLVDGDHAALRLLRARIDRAMPGRKPTETDARASATLDSALAAVAPASAGPVIPQQRRG